ncbi:MAG: acyl-phosphate glycerol 3-phosphate acyltransferase [Proteobacteria bacterium]|nr:MAG: acyl-phosphate glycerol 3-phosphate acyltransferase [Pseudomonadota bacterium]
MLLAYLLGSLLGSLIVGRLRGGVDIRTMGSGNAGGTNALRTQGVGFAAAVMLIDVGKGWLAAAWLPYWSIGSASPDGGLSQAWLVTACGAAVTIGHVYPVWYGFRGGKGAATLIGVLAGVRPDALLPVLGVWLAVVMLTGFVGLATMLAGLAFPAYLVLEGGPDAALLTLGCAMALFVVFTHRSNIQRMLVGTENRARRLWLLRPR